MRHSGEKTARPVPCSGMVWDGQKPSKHWRIRQRDDVGRCFVGLKNDDFIPAGTQERRGEIQGLLRAGVVIEPADVESVDEDNSLV